MNAMERDIERFEKNIDNIYNQLGSIAALVMENTERLINIADEMATNIDVAKTRIQKAVDGISDVKMPTMYNLENLIRIANELYSLRPEVLNTLITVIRAQR